MFHVLLTHGTFAQIHFISCNYVPLVWATKSFLLSKPTEMFPALSIFTVLLENVYNPTFIPLFKNKFNHKPVILQFPSFACVRSLQAKFLKSVSQRQLYYYKTAQTSLFGDSYELSEKANANVLLILMREFHQHLHCALLSPSACLLFIPPKALVK